MANKEILDIIKNLPSMVWVYIGLIVVLAIASFILPPLGVIDESVISAIWPLFGGASVFVFACCLPNIVSTICHKGGNFKVGGEINGAKASIELNKEKDE